MAAAERVFRAVAPALPPGMPMDPSRWRDAAKYKVVIADAAAFDA
jgi:hypothetical protein